MGGSSFGIVAALLGNCIIGAGQCLQKYAINQVQQLEQEQHRQRQQESRQIDHSPERSPSKGHPRSSIEPAPSRLRNRYWILGLIMCYLGEVCGNWIGLMYASAASITPLGIVSVLVNATLASLFLYEPWTKGMRRGYLLIAVGVLLILSVAPSTRNPTNTSTIKDEHVAVEEITTERQWIHYLTHSWFQPTVLLLIAISIVLIYKIVLADTAVSGGAHRRGQSGGTNNSNNTNNNSGAQRSGRHAQHSDGAVTATISPSISIHWFVAAASLFGGITVLSSKMVSCILRVWASGSVSQNPTAAILAEAAAASVHDLLHHQNQTVASTGSVLNAVTATTHDTNAYTPEAAQSALFILIITLVGSVVGQEVFKQQALSRFPVSLFQPLFYAAYNSVAVLSSVFAFQELPPTAASWLWFIGWFALAMTIISRGSLEVSGGNLAPGDKPLSNDLKKN